MVACRGRAQAEAPHLVSVPPMCAQCRRKGARLGRPKMASGLSWWDVTGNAGVSVPLPQALFGQGLIDAVGRLVGDDITAGAGSPVSQVAGPPAPLGSAGPLPGTCP